MNLGLPLRPGCDETHQVPLRLIVKEEEYGHMITWQDEEEKPIADLLCKTESDFTESLSSTYNEILQTTVEVKVKKEEDDQQHNDCLLESKSFQTDALRAVLNGGQLMLTSEYCQCAGIYVRFKRCQ